MMFSPLPMLTECMACSAMIRNSEPSKARHAEWHLQLTKRLALPTEGDDE